MDQLSPASGNLQKTVWLATYRRDVKQRPMAAPIFSAFTKELEEIVAICLGTRTTKAVHLRRQNDGFVLLNYVLLETPRPEKGLSHEALTDHFKNVRSALGVEVKEAVVVIGMGESLLRNVDLPALPPAELRRMLKFNSFRYLNQDLPDFVFDCGVRNPLSAGGSPAVAASTGSPKTLVAGAKNKVVEELQSAAEEAGWVVDHITLSQIGLANAARLAMTDLVQREVVAMVDLGFVTTTISILVDGEPQLTRVVGIGADKFTSGLADAMSVSYPAAEGVKVAMPEKVQEKLQAVISPLGRELRAAIDFFEDQEVKTVTKVFLTGGSARSDFIIQTLHADLGTPCKRWDPTSFLTLELPPPKAREVERDATQLAAAIGAGVTCLDSKLPQINLLADQLAAAQARRRDPVRRGFQLATAVVVLLLGWAGVLGGQLSAKHSELDRSIAELRTFEKAANATTQFSKKAAEVEIVITNLVQHSTNRFVWARPLDALQLSLVEDIQIVHITLDQLVVNSEASKPTMQDDKPVPGKPGFSTEKIILTIQAKNFGDSANVDKFIEAIAATPHFRNSLRKSNPIILKNRFPPQVDPVDPAISFTLFTIECNYAERVVGHD